MHSFLDINLFLFSASLYGEMKKYKESEKMFRKALKLNPTYTEAYFNLGKIARDSKKIKHLIRFHTFRDSVYSNGRVG